MCPGPHGINQGDNLMRPSGLTPGENATDGPPRWVATDLPTTSGTSLFTAHHRAGPDHNPMSPAPRSAHQPPGVPRGADPGSAAAAGHSGPGRTPPTPVPSPEPAWAGHPPGTVWPDRLVDPYRHTDTGDYTLATDL